MAFLLDDYIDKYVQDAGDTDKKIAQHLKKIISRTTHLDENTFNEIIEELKKEMDTGESFKIAFQKVCQKYVLTGHIITAELPDILTRIIANKRLFFEFLKFRLGIDEVEIKNRIISNGIHYFIRLIGHLDLAPPHNHVVFAAFDEENMEADPFNNCTVNDILNMLGKDKRNFKKGESLSAVKIRYRNQNNWEKKFPIFPDAGWYDKFFPSKENDKYGRTQSLDPKRKGLPEIVHENVKFSEITQDIEFIED